LQLSGRYFDGRSSAALPAELELLTGGMLRLSAGGALRSATLSDVQVSDRIGNMQRRIHFADGASCELADNDAVDAWIAGGGRRPRLHDVYWLERSWPYALGALVALAALSWLFAIYGVPLLAQAALRGIPASLDQTLGRGTLSALDNLYVKPTELGAARQRELRDIFASVVNDQPDPQHFRLELRRGARLGPNALALPDGAIVLTDELASLSRNPDELRAVFAHEVGHVIRRHGMLTVLQTSGVAALMYALFADVASTSHLMAGAPALLANARYSRALEAEADDVAFVYLRRHNIPSHVMQDLLRRVEKKLGKSAADMGYLATHPATSARDRR
jgi:Zn-dependent protease with chaperone function